MKIILIGYMGSGKSSVGRQLAASLNYKFIDLDQAIAQETGSSISDLFATKGEVYFRKMERKLLAKILTDSSNLVLASGGGTPCYGDMIQFLKSVASTTVYLKTSNEELTRRLFNERQQRPLIAHLNTELLLNDFIKKHLFERSYFYNQSDLKVATDYRSVETIVEEIKNNLPF
ncbi:shikimate kinase [Flavobacteriaceae bacterium]|mgnify:FL=1|nr:shikimate kinase [Flavobacteriaceae bacterium]